MAGRELAKFEVPYQGRGALFADERHDNATVASPDYAHCTFANVSFLGTSIAGGVFRNCVFIECYFRHTALKNSRFVGCKFVNCNFTHATIRDCDFRYAEFRGSAPPFSELMHSAPQQANLRHELFASLARVADSSGDGDAARKYRLASIEALEQHLRAAVRADTGWYREHFDTLGRVAAAARLAWLQVNRALWRHGESAWQLLACAMVTVLLVFPVMYALLVSGLHLPGDRAATLGDFLWLSLSTFLSVDSLSSVALTGALVRIAAAVEGLLGVIFAGMYVTLLVKALLRR